MTQKVMLCTVSNVPYSVVVQEQALKSPEHRKSFKFADVVFRHINRIKLILKGKRNCFVSYSCLRYNRTTQTSYSLRRNKGRHRHPSLRLGNLEVSIFPYKNSTVFANVIAYSTK